MSVQEASQQPSSPVSPKTEAKPRPDIPPKPSACSPPPLGDTEGSTNLSSGKVKSIVNKFSKQTSTEEQPTNGTAEITPINRFKRPPTVKPKPSRNARQLQTGGQQAPPLPVKKRATLKKQKSVGQDEGDGTCVAGGRSAPDGKEVEVQLGVGGEAGVEHNPDTPRNPSCNPGCSCACHLQHPGMKMIWVPEDMEFSVSGEDDDDTDLEVGSGEDEENLEEEKGEVVQVEGGREAGSEVDRTPVAKEKEVVMKKTKFHQTLDVLISEGHRRRSDPGPPSVLNSLTVIRSQSPPVPPKQTHSSSVMFKPTEYDDNNIYESVLPMFDPRFEKSTPVCKEPNVPLIKLLKPPRRSKLFNSVSDPMPDSLANNEPASNAGEMPPAIPPRVPMTQDNRTLTPLHRGGIPLPQPTKEEWRNLLPSAHNSSTATPPAVSPLVPHRPPPPPPRIDPRRLSSASVQSLAQKKEVEENGESEGEKEDTVEELSSRRSINWESRLQDEPLYQTYRASVIHKEIRRQTVCRNISKTSVDYAMDTLRSGTGTGLAVGNGTQRSSPVPTPVQSTLWQDLPAVRESGELEKLTSDECKYQESMFEVLTSEASYFRSLRVLTEHFLDSRELEDTMIIRDKKTLFSNILKVQEVSERFLKDLEDRIFGEVVFPDICDIIYYHAQHKFPAYIDYVRNQIYQDQTFTRLMKNNTQFATVITRLQESPQCQRLPFMSFLLLPFQRITRIKMLIENILKRTKEGTKAEEMASKALASVSKIIDECNTEVGRMRQMEELIQLSHTLEFDKLKAIPIISQTRYLEKKGELQEMSKGGTLFNMKAKFNSIYLFLFNDLLIIATKKGAERFVVVDHAHRSLVQVQPMEEGCPHENCFCLTLLDNHQSRMIERLLKAPSQSDMQRWMAAFPKPPNADAVEDEVIYEDWDCPQVQCVEQYVAQQADELNLEPTEIVNIIRKSNEGWCEGSRLSDGQKGWFPVGNVIEITNEHVRRRNLRERYRVMQAAIMVASSKFGNTH